MDNKIYICPSRGNAKSQTEILSLYRGIVAKYGFDVLLEETKALLCVYFGMKNEEELKLLLETSQKKEEKQHEKTRDVGRDSGLCNSDR